MRGVGFGTAAWALSLIVSLLAWRGTDVPDWLFYPALCLLVFLTLAGIYLAGIEAIDFLRKPQNHQRNRTPPASDIHVSSWHQRGGTTAGVINLSLSEKKGDEDAGR